MQPNINNYNIKFNKYPKLVYDKGWIYGTWYCGTSFVKCKFYGMYPPTFLDRLMSIFPSAQNVLHCPSGTVNNNGDVTVDCIVDEQRKPMIRADASCLPFKNNSFDLIISDPPYSKKDSEIYGCDSFPLGKMIKESYRILKPGGYLCMLHIYYPSYRRKDFDLQGLITVITGFMRQTRIVSIFRTKK